MTRAEQTAVPFFVVPGAAQKDTLQGANLRFIVTSLAREAAAPKEPYETIQA